jgi:hypothetical protein
VTAGTVYPRLTDRAALVLRDEFLGLTPEEAAEKHALDHPGAYYAAVGGRRVKADELRVVRKAALEAVEPWLALSRARQLNRGNRAEMDGPLGRALHEAMGILPSDAAHDGVWSFMALVLLPEVSVARFPEGHVNRWLGRPRNGLRRTWWRYQVLGDLIDPPDDSLWKHKRPLGEDELVGIFERSTIATDRRLAVGLAERVLAYDGRDRSNFARRVSRRVLADLAYTEVGILSDEELTTFIETALSVAADPPAVGATADSDSPHHPASSASHPSPRRPPPPPTPAQKLKSWASKLTDRK